MSIMNKDVAYWLIHDEYETPKSDDWVNDLYPIYPGISTFEEMAEAIAENLKKDCPAHYAIIVDTDSKDELKTANAKFISNNIVKISKSCYDAEKVRQQIEWVFSEFSSQRKSAADSTFFWSDPHFGHQNIIRYCNRPWNSGVDSNGDLIVTEDDAKKMDEDLIANFNSIVPEDGLTWCLGDFALGKNQQQRIPEILSKLHGKVNLVLGNHDHHSVDFYYKAGFHRVYDRPIVINSFCILSHAPLAFTKAPFFNIYGHVHQCETYKTWSKDSCCVCVERHDYNPVSMQEIKEKWEKLNGEKNDI